MAEYTVDTDREGTTVAEYITYIYITGIITVTAHLRRSPSQIFGENNGISSH